MTSLVVTTCKTSSQKCTNEIDLDTRKTYKDKTRRLVLPEDALLLQGRHMNKDSVRRQIKISAGDNEED